MVRYVVIASIPGQRLGKVIYSGSSKAKALEAAEQYKKTYPRRRVWVGRRYGKW